MRGGTSTGVIVNKKDLPCDIDSRDIILRKIMGIPEYDLSGNMQITGLGRGVPTSNKLFIIEVIDSSKRKVNSTLAQFASDKRHIDWSVNCGNMSSAIPMYLIDNDLIDVSNGVNKIEIFNTNTQKNTNAFVEISNNNLSNYIEIPGVVGSYPSVKLEFDSPVGVNTGLLFPTGNKIDIICDIEVTCVDVNVPMVILNAADIGKSGHESVECLISDESLQSKLQEIWVLAGLKMKLKNVDGQLMNKLDLANSETIPKICMVSTSSSGENINTRYFTPQKPHRSLAVSGGGCLAVACLFEGTVAQKISSYNAELNNDNQSHCIKIENPAGVLDIDVFMTSCNVDKILYSRNAQILMKGSCVIYDS